LHFAQRYKNLIYISAAPFIVDEEFPSDLLPGFRLKLEEVFQTEVPDLPEEVPVTVEEGKAD